MSESPRIVDPPVKETADWGPPYRLFVLLRMAQDKCVGAPFQGALSGFLSSLAPFLDREKRVAIRTRAGYLFLNGRRLPVDFRAFHATRFLVELFKVRRIGGVRFAPGVSRAEVMLTLRALLAQEQKDQALMGAMLSSPEISHVKVLSEPRRGHDPLSPAMEEGHRLNRDTNFKSLFITKRILGGIRDNFGIEVTIAKRIVHGIVDLILEEHETLGTLMLLRESNKALFDHSLNVAVISVIIGQYMGLPRRLLGTLGVSGLFHDLGLSLPPFPIDEERRSDWLCEDRSVDSDHIVKGFINLLKGRELSDLALRNAVVAWEHHLNSNGSGPGSCRWRSLRPTLLARIVKVADNFEYFCSVEELSPYDAAKRLNNAIDLVYDPDVIKALFQALKS